MKGLKTRLLIAIIAALSGVKRASVLEFFISGDIIVELLGNAKGATKSAFASLSKMNETVCGSATAVGLYHVTLSPFKISTCLGE